MAFQIAALFIAALGTGLQVQAQERSRGSQRRQLQLQREQQAIENRRARVEQLRESRIRQATLRATAQAAGVSGASSALGALGSVQSQLGANLGQISQQQEAQRQASVIQSDLISARGQSQLGGSLTSFGGALFSFGSRSGKT